MTTSDSVRPAHITINLSDKEKGGLSDEEKGGGRLLWTILQGRVGDATEEEKIRTTTTQREKEKEWVRARATQRTAVAGGGAGAKTTTTEAAVEATEWTPDPR